MDQQFSLRWNNYLNQITDAFGSLKNEEDLVDVTLSCEGKKLKAHKMLLSACSSYFKEVFKENPCPHPVIVFQNFKYVDLEAIVDFMYKGEVDVKQEHFESFLGTAELLQVKGLTEGSKSNNSSDDDSNAPKVVDSGNELLSEDLMKKPLSPSHPHPKKRKNSTLSDKRKSSEKKQKAAEPLPITPKIEFNDEELIEDLTFDEDDSDDTHSTNTDLAQDPLKPSSPGNLGYYRNRSVPDLQDPSQLPKGHAHLPEAGSSGELVPPDIMQTQEFDSTRTNNMKNKKITEVQTDSKEMGIDKSSPVLKPSSSNRIKQITLKNLGRETISTSVNSNLVLDEKLSNQNEFLNIDRQKNLDDTIATAVAHPSKSTSLNLPKELTVTIKEKEQMNFGSYQYMEEEALLRSEEAMTPVPPVDEKPLSSQLPEVCCDEPTAPRQLVLGEPEIDEEAPQMISDEVYEEEEVEPEFDYFGCETCKAEAKPVDKFKLTLTHKCPICPSEFFCAHLLKGHMKLVHGWFNVQRRFNQY